jgi:hypothetical protein
MLSSASIAIEALMLDLVSILAIAAMFAVGCLYVWGCDRLRGTRR